MGGRRRLAAVSCSKAATYLFVKRLNDTFDLYFFSLAMCQHIFKEM